MARRARRRKDHGSFSPDVIHPNEFLFRHSNAPSVSKYTGMKSLKLYAKFVLLFTILTFFQIILEPRDIKFMIG